MPIIDPATAFSISRTSNFELDDFFKKNVTENFTWPEVFTSRTIADVKSASLQIFKNALLQALRMEKIRACVREKLNSKAVIRVSSWYRSPTANAAVGGAKGSQHLLALATDFIVSGYEGVSGNRKVQAALIPVMKSIGFCLEITDGEWTHADGRNPPFAFTPKGRVLTQAELNSFMKSYGNA